MSAHVGFHSEAPLPQVIRPGIHRYGKGPLADYFLTLEYAGNAITFHSLNLAQIQNLVIDLDCLTEAALRSRCPHLLDEAHPPAIVEGYVNQPEPRKTDYQLDAERMQGRA